jgi:hypothetical protein
MKIRFPLLLILFNLLSGLSYSQGIREKIQEKLARNRNYTIAPGTAPDYADLFYWAAHPWKKDNSDRMPKVSNNEPIDSAVDVFFLHPTSYTRDIRNSYSNADLYDSVVNNQTDKIMLMQASVFNNSARIFAPRYRQAHLKAYLAPQSIPSQKAFDLAYQDLKTAFQYYLDHWNHGRPVIIASHSQGAMHAIRLLKEFFDGKPLQKQLVCAYIVGWQIKKDDFINIPVCNSPGATGCYAGWRSYQQGETDFVVNLENGNSVCVNPVSWTTAYEPVSKEMHKGAYAFDSIKYCMHCISTQVDSIHKVLWVKLPEDAAKKFAKLKNLHVGDYNLFYVDIRENAAERIRSYLTRPKP